MHQKRIVTEISERLQRAGLIPPVASLEWHGDADEDAEQEQAVLIGIIGAALTRDLGGTDYLLTA